MCQVPHANRRNIAQYHAPTSGPVVSRKEACTAYVRTCVLQEKVSVHHEHDQGRGRGRRRQYSLFFRLSPSLEGFFAKFRHCQLNVGAEVENDPRTGRTTATGSAAARRRGAHYQICKPRCAWLPACPSRRRRCRLVSSQHKK